MEDSPSTDVATVICVLGMHRCGTSFFTRVVNLLGVYLGPEQSLMESREVLNPKGFWEHNEIYKLNERILAEFGGSWHEPPDFQSGWASSTLLGDVREQARALIQSDFAKAALWGWKDPRACLVLPFWKTILPRMKHIICLRNPVEVALSLQRGYGMPVEKGARLWLEYVRSALENTAGESRFLIFYEDFLTEPDRYLSNLAAYVGLAGRERDPEIRNSIDEFASKELRHHRVSVLDAVAEPALSFPVKSLYLALALRFRLSEGRDPAELDPLLATTLQVFGHYAHESLQEFADRDSEISILKEQIADLNQRLTDRDVTLQVLSAELEDKTSQIARLSASLGGRLLARYGRFKYRHLLPLYRMLNAVHWGSGSGKKD